MVVEGLDAAKLIQALPIQDPSAGISGQQPKQSVDLRHDCDRDRLRLGAT